MTTRPMLKIKVYSLATDDDGGTNSAVFINEREMEDAIIAGTGGHYSSYTRADFEEWLTENPDGDLNQWWDEHRGDLDSYSTDEQELELELPPIAEQMRGVTHAAKVEMALALMDEARALFTSAATTPIRVAVALDGGLVQGAVADRPGVSVTTIDYDTEGADADEVRAIPQDGGDTAEATIGGVSATFDPAWLDAAEGAELADLEAAIAVVRARVKRYEEGGDAGLAADAIADAEELERKLAWKNANEAIERKLAAAGAARDAA
jgi:hypothetical protein